MLQNITRPADAPAQAREFAALLDGLRLPVLIGALSHKDAVAIVERHLDQLPTARPRL